jgi:hypothetical protein
MRKIKRTILLSFFLLVFFSFSALAATIPTGAKTSCGSSNYVVDRSVSGPPNQKTVEKWESAIKQSSIPGETWIGKLQSNGPNDDFYRLDTGRETIIFMPCTTDLTKPVELIYFFHGNEGFDTDMAERIAPQSKQMSQQGRNFIVVFPELPWSAGTEASVRGWANGSKNPNGRFPHGMIWKGGDSNLVQLHKEVLATINQVFGSVNVGYTSMTGHSGGGSALRKASEFPSKQNNALMQINVNKITFSDADYGWAGDGTSATRAVYDNYVASRPNVELNMLVQDVKQSGAHDPTKFSIDFVKEIGGPTVQSWSWEQKNTPGISVGNAFKVPNHPNIHYVSLGLNHKSIGAMSLAWLSPLGTGPLATVEQQQQQSLPSQQSSVIPGQTTLVLKNLPSQQREIDESWSKKIGNTIRQSVLIWDDTLGNWDWRNYTDVYFTVVQSQQPSQINPGPSSAIRGDAPAFQYQIPTMNIRPELKGCILEVKKLVDAAGDMTEWKHGGCGSGTDDRGNPRGAVADECNPASTTTCCYMQHSGCCYGVPNDPVNGIEGSCRTGCCGSYVWQVFNIAINKHHLPVSWPLYLNQQTKAYERDPGDIKSEYKIITLNQWSDPNMEFDKGNFKPTDLIPGDLVYFKWPVGTKGKCPETKTCLACKSLCNGNDKCIKDCERNEAMDCRGGSSHINIVGPPTADGKKYHIIDVSCKKDGICTFSNWIYPDFLYEKSYCKDRTDPNLFDNPAKPILAGEAWKYVYRMIPECMDVVNNIGFSTKNSGVRVG